MNDFVRETQRFTKKWFRDNPDPLGFVKWFNVTRKNPKFLTAYWAANGNKPWSDLVPPQHKQMLSWGNFDQWRLSKQTAKLLKILANQYTLLQHVNSIK